MKTAVTHSGKQTQRLGKNLAKKLSGQEVLALYGNLGSGKTEFVKGLAAGLGVKKTVTSPTFSLLNHYAFKKSGKKIAFFHLDLYRIRNKKEVGLLGLPELLASPDRLVAIEWPEKTAGLLPSNRLAIFFAHGKKSNERKIRLPNLLA